MISTATQSHLSSSPSATEAINPPVKHNHIGNKLAFKLAMNIGVSNLGLFGVLMILFLTNQLNIGSVLLGTSIVFTFFLLFAFTSLSKD